MKLNKIYVVEINPTSSFDFDSTFHKPDHFTSGDNYWEPGVRWQTWAWKGEKLGLKFENIGSKNNPRIILSIYAGEKMSDNLINSLMDEVKYRYNLDLDLTGFYKKFKNDNTLGPIFKKWEGMRPGHPALYMST